MAEVSGVVILHSGSNLVTWTRHQAPDDELKVIHPALDPREAGPSLFMQQLNGELRMRIQRWN